MGRWIRGGERGGNKDTELNKEGGGKYSNWRNEIKNDKGEIQIWETKQPHHYPYAHKHVVKRSNKASVVGTKKKKEEEA